MNFPDVTKLLESVHKQEESGRPVLSGLQKDARLLASAARKVEESASGSNFGYHGELYYGNFERPPLDQRFNVEWGGINGLPPNWSSRTPEEVKQRVEELGNTQFAKLEETCAQLLKSAKDLRDEILIALAALHSMEGLIKENEILQELEHLDWAEDAKNKYCISAMKNFPNMTRDSNAIMQGSMLPSHTYYEGAAIQVEKSCEAIEKFWKLSQRLLRQLQAQQSSNRPSPAHTDALAVVRQTCQRFHAVALQLNNRRQGRSTLKISDEYDVQDLLNAMLRINFDDVRPEEPTPSFGGGAARMDFLLKKERIVVEAKMTRADLRDKAISDELIQDVARYRSHADCKMLICLVYDPQGLLKNPGGVIHDIQKLSSESLFVEVHVVPER